MAEPTRANPRTEEVASSMSPPRISRPRLAPAAVPTRTAVGVASPSAHGHAVTSTLPAICALRMSEAAAPEPVTAAPALTQAAHAAAAAAAPDPPAVTRTLRCRKGSKHNLPSDSLKCNLFDSH